MCPRKWGSGGGDQGAAEVNPTLKLVPLTMKSLGRYEEYFTAFLWVGSPYSFVVVVVNVHCGRGN